MLDLPPALLEDGDPGRDVASLTRAAHLEERGHLRAVEPREEAREQATTVLPDVRKVEAVASALGGHVRDAAGGVLPNGAPPPGVEPHARESDEVRVTKVGERERARGRQREREQP